jgi:polar amino acid transport system substrate-binding protein
MKRRTAFAGLLPLLGLLIPVLAGAVDAELAKDSTLEGILSRGELRIGLEAGYMPFEMIDTRGGLRQRALRPGDERRSGQQVNIIGFDIDIGREMAKALGVKLVPVNTLWTSIIPALNVGRFDIIISGMSITEQRQRQVDFADPYMTIGQTVLVHKKHEGTVRSYQDLNDPAYTIASKPGTTGEEAVKQRLPKATYKPFDTEIEAATAVADGEVDAFVYDSPYHAVFFAMQGPENLVFLDEPFTTESLAWAIRKNDPDFLNWLNGFLREIKEDGRYDRIYNRWFKRTDWFSHVR